MKQVNEMVEIQVGKKKRSNALAVSTGKKFKSHGKKYFGFVGHHCHNITIVQKAKHNRASS